MALSTKPLSLLFLTLFLLSHNTQARDSQFFSKVTNVKNDNDQKETTTTTTVVNPDAKNGEEEPTFFPETRNDGYGLYGHESGQLSPSDEQKHFTTNSGKTNYAPYRTPVSGNNNLYSDNYYNQKNDNSDKYYNNYNDNSEFQRQGMSDTRFMEKGKYFYDVSNEKMTTYNPNTYREQNYNPNSYRNDNNYNKVVDYSNPKNWYNNRANNNNNYYGNNANDNYNNNNNNNNNNYNNDNHNQNSFEGYQNDEAFQENEEFEP